MAIQPNQPMTIGGVLDTTFQLYKASIAQVWILCIMGAIGGVFPVVYMMVGGFATPDPTDPFAVFAMFTQPGYWLANLATLILSLWSMGATYLKMHAVGTDVPMTLGEALGASIKRVPMLFLVSILFGIAVLIGLVLLLVPGFILMVSLILSFNLLLIEGRGPIESLTGSHRLVWGNWWRTAAVLTVGLILVMVIYAAVGLVIGVAIPLIGLGSDDPLMFSMISNLVLGVLASLTLTPFYIGMAISLYWDLKMRKEGGDLAARVGALGTA